MRSDRCSCDTAKMVNFTAASSNCSDAGISRQSRSITPSRRVCRNLFGTDNHDEFREVRQQNIERLQEKKLQYNFDFEKEEPLPGRYLWERVSNSNRTKSCNKLPIEDRAISKNRGSQVLSKKDSPKNTSTKDQGEHKITDYFRSKKRKYDETTEKDHIGINEPNKIKHTTHRDLDKACTCLNACKCT